MRLYAMPTDFQYQKGAIKTVVDQRIHEVPADFQYQKGAIKTPQP